MKKIMIALAIAGIGICYSGAEAQTTTITTTTVTKKPCKCATAAARKAKPGNGAHTGGTAKSGDTYQVCREQGGYYSCCTHHTKATTKTAATKPAPKVAVK